FGSCFSPIMFVAEYHAGKWDGGKIVPYGPLPIYPSAKVLHYAQSIFEGFKAYFVYQNRPQLFRAGENFKRLNRSAERLSMPEVPEDLFFDGLKALVSLSTPLIPKEHNSSLYLRPVYFGTTGELGIGPAGDYTLVILASPSALYSKGAIRVLIERENVRAAPGGTGHVKAAANYASTLHSTAHVAEYGCRMGLWLDPINREDIEEFSGMNFFCVIDGELVTPKLTGTLLPGITRASILEIARYLEIPVRETAVKITDLLAAIKYGACTEAFGAGTAAIITPIAALVEHDKSDYPLPSAPGPVSERLREALLDLQEGRTKDPFGWMMDV
ncbi:MAG: branched-chain amino acid aminotransferase, partial [Sphingomonadales bacterium]